MLEPIIARHPTGPPPDSYRPTAERLFPTAERIEGDGRYAVVITMLGRTVVLLWTWVDDALDAKLHLDETTAQTPALHAPTSVHDLRLFVEAVDA